MCIQYKQAVSATATLIESSLRRGVASQTLSTTDSKCVILDNREHLVAFTCLYNH